MTGRAAGLASTAAAIALPLAVISGPAPAPRSVPIVWAPAAPVMAADEQMVAEPVRLRRRHSARRGRPVLRPHAVKMDPAASSSTPKTVRIIPIRRWKPWCDRIGGIEC